MEWHTWYNLIKHNLAKKPSEKTLEKEERRDEEEMKVLYTYTPESRECIEYYDLCRSCH